ncbi:HAMP domain-containing protein [Oxalobacteraceae bacterium CAVE-383]|nr:HAMP domain-containing protein [Oxalobacteraceae bacterium CAVE-383]
MLKIDPSKKLPVIRLPAMSLQMVLSILLFGVVLIVGSVLTILNYERGRDMANSASTVLFEHIESEIALQLSGMYTPISQLVDLMIGQPLVRDRNLQARLLHLPSLVEAMQHSPALSAVYIGYANGDFFQLRRLKPGIPTILDMTVPPGAVYLVQSVNRTAGAGHPWEGVFLFLSRDLQVLDTQSLPGYAFDPRRREWYRQALDSASQVQTPPYIFFSTSELGISIARRSADQRAVVGADISLGDLSDMLHRQSISPSAELALTDGDAAVMAYRKPEMMGKSRDGQGRMRMTMLPELGGRQFAALAEKIRARQFSKAFETEIDDRIWSGRIVPVRLGDAPFYLAISVPEDELLADARRMLNNGLLVTLVLLLGAIPVAAVVAWRLGLPLRRLAREAKAMQDFDFSSPGQGKSRIHEIEQLMCSMNETRLTIQRFTEISVALAAEQNFDRLLERIVTETMSIAHADAGILYLLDDERKVARPQLVKWTDQAGQAQAQNPPEAVDIHIPGHAEHLLCRTLRTGVRQFVNMDPQAMRRAAWLGDIATHLPEQPHILATIPLKNRREETIGAILWIGPIKDGGAQSHLFAFLEALSGAAAISIENKQLIKAQVDLLEGMIQVIAGAIDAKSPYTGGHCQRVPELTKMLAQAACDDDRGPFRDFSLTEDQWKEVHVASWLHDCGKMTTPEFVVDKATKLETIYDRLHEIRMRFEIIKRDRRISALESVADGAEADAVRAELARQLAQLDDDFAFIASCNEGSERMAPESMQRVREIAGHTWWRTLDDRIGIAWEERERKNRLPASPLPAQERLLDDRVDHRIERRAQDCLEPDNVWGFKVEMPALLYNRGEIYNLCIERGTLTPEERYKVNEHIIQTIIMLNRLPFPRHLANVPEIAGGHHEKMNGNGYPKRLKREEMSPVARMMAVADIFEALTAADRPYKKGKKLSEAIGIMIRMKNEGHIDPDVFNLFFNSGIYLTYAKKYMDPELIDTIAD